jgi:hypothetical protein
VCLPVAILVAVATLGLNGVAAASTPPTTLPSSWNTTTSNNVLVDCTAATAQGSAGLNAQICFGQMSANGHGYVAAVLAVNESSTATTPKLVSAIVRNVEHRNSSSRFTCSSQTITPGQTLYCMTGGTMADQPGASSIFTARGQLASAHTSYPWIRTPATKF